MLFFGKSQSGDTLVEVAIALALLSFVLLASTNLTIIAFNTGRAAQFRVSSADSAQEQIEELRSFRDNNSWEDFLKGSSSASPGVINVRGGSCSLVSVCFHMVQQTVGSSTQFVPASGPTTSSAPGSYVELTATPVPSVNPTVVQFNIYYGSDSPLGPVDLTGQIQTELADLTAASAPTDAAASYGEPHGNHGTGHVFVYTSELINESPLTLSQISSCSWNWGDGSTPNATACDPGDDIYHSFPVGVTATYTVTLTEYLTDGRQATYVNTVKIPHPVSCMPGPSNPQCIP